MSEIKPIKINKNIDVSSLNKIYTNKNDAKSSSNSLNVISSKQYYDDANLELFQVDADNDGVLDDVYRIDKVSEDETRTSMGYVNDKEVNISKPISSEPESIQAIYSNSEHAKEFHKFENVKKQINENTKYVGDPIQHNMKEVSSVSDYTAGAASINNQSIDAQSSKKSILKTVALFEASQIEGMVSIGENVRDFIEMTGTKAIGKVMLKIGYINQDAYDEMLEETKANVLNNDVKDLMFNPLYKKTGITENVYFENLVREVGNGVGKTFEIIGLSLAGGEIASSAIGTSGSSATTFVEKILTNSQNYSRISRWTLAGITGAGEELQHSYQEGATIDEGLKASYIKGLWDSAQWIIGEGINNFNPFKESNFVTNQIKNSALHVFLDAIDSGVEGFVQPAIENIYIDKSYNDIFQDNGGWGNVGALSLFGAIISYSIGERKNIKNAKNLVEEINIKDINQITMSLFDDLKKPTEAIYKLADGTNISYNEAILKAADNEKKGILKQIDPEAISVTEHIDRTLGPIKASAQELLNKRVDISKTIKGLASYPITFLERFVDSRLLNNPTLLQNSLNNGLLHFTSLETANKIIDSEFVKAGGDFLSNYGTKKKTFFFTDVPEIEDILVNLDTLEPKRVAVKIMPEKSQIENFNYRELVNDGAVYNDGDFHFNKEQANLVYYGLVNDNGKLAYKEISKSEYDNFVPSLDTGLIANKLNSFRTKLIVFSKEADYLSNSLKQLKNSIF